MIRFYSFRLSLILPSQPTLFPDPVTKEEHFIALLKRLHSEKKTSFISRKAKFLLISEKEMLSGVYGLILAREEIYTKPIEGATTIEEVKDTRNPFIYVIIDQQRQLVLIQDKPSVFQEIETPKARLEDFFTLQLGANNITVSLQPITDKNEFWSEVEQASEIQEFDITLNAPNLFKGRFKASEFVKEVHELYNITEFTVKLKNKLGQLKLYKDNLQDFVALAAAGAGKYIMKAVKNGQDFVIKSYEIIAKKNYPVDNLSDINPEKLNEDLDSLDKMNDEQQEK